MSKSISQPLELGEDAGISKTRNEPNMTNTEDNEVKNSSLAKIFDFINVKKIGENDDGDRIKVKGKKNRENFEVSRISDADENQDDDESFYAGSKKEEEVNEGNNPGEGGSGDDGSEGGSGDDDEEEEEIDYDEEIEDDDIRYTLAADKAVEFILHARSVAIKPGYEEFKKLIEYAESLKMVLILLITVFIVLARPIWCSDLGSKINWECTMSQDPEDPKHFYKSALPVLSSGTKRVILIVCMMGIFMLDLMKIIITRGDRTQRVSFYVNMGLLVIYAMGFYCIEFKILSINFLDIFALLFVIFGIKILQKTLMKFMIVLIDSKEILIFFILFMMTIAMIGRLLFFRVDQYYDAEGTTFGFNFQNFSNSLYSMTIANFLQDNFFDGVGALMIDHKLLVIYWLVTLFLNKFMLGNFLCGILYNSYNALFSKDKKYMRREQFKEIRISLKREILNENLKGAVFKKIMTNYTKTGSFDKNIEEIENFYSLSMNNKHKAQYDKGNPDSMSGYYNTIKDQIWYIGMLGGLEGVNYFLIIITFEMETENIYPMIAMMISINLIIVIDRFLYLSNNYYGDGEKWLIIDIILSLTIMGLGMQCLAIQEHSYFTDMMNSNRQTFKWMCTLLVIKSIRFLKLFGYNKQIAVVTKVIFDSFAFVKDILGIIVIFFFLFSAIGMAMFGGNVNSDTPKNFEEMYGDEPDMGLLMMCFNDYYLSIFTLFTVMLGGWTDVIKVNTVNFGRDNNSLIYNIYFIIYFFFVSLCFLNTLFGFLVDNVAANLDATIAEEEGESVSAKTSGNTSVASSDDEEGKKPTQYGDLNEDLDNFVGMKKNGDEDDEADNGDVNGEKQPENFKLNENYDPVEDVLNKVPIK